MLCRRVYLDLDSTVGELHGHGPEPLAFKIKNFSVEFFFSRDTKKNFPL